MRSKTALKLAEGLAQEPLRLFKEKAFIVQAMSIISDASEPLVLDIRGVSKAFGGTQALKSVNFQLRHGEIHALAGENGAGKSTLMNIIDGIHQPDNGEIRINGSRVTVPSPAEAQELGVGFVHQEIALCPDISVAENIFMAKTNTMKAWFMDYRALYKKATEFFAQLSPLDPEMLVGGMSISNQQLVEIAKALTLDCRILILDEPTAALTEKEAQILFNIMHDLKDQGMSIIYISHRMAEIFENCDRVTVFRDGTHVLTDDVSNLTEQDIINSMVGRVIDRLYPDKQTNCEKTDDVILQVHGLSERTRFRDISFDLRRGEILGFAGLIGAGRSEIAKAICGLEGDEISGTVMLNGQPFKAPEYIRAVEQGVVYLSEDRKGDGLFLSLLISQNISALKLEQVCTGWGLVDKLREVRQARAFGDRLNLKCGHITHPVSNLSGGNQQKVALAKMLSVNPVVIFLDEPTRGVDVGAKSEIHCILRDLAREGVGILVISSELPELIGLCDRVLVIREGHLGGEVSGNELTEENIMHLASIPTGTDAMRDKN